jgi:uncharacterized membrane protein HdeD (DUF308 family)
MLQLLARNWWLLVVRGLFAILFGILAFTMPGVTLSVLVLLWGVYSAADGILALWTALSGRGGESKWALVLEGLVGLAAAAAAFLYPGLTTMVLLYVIAAWAILTGLLQLAAAIRLRKEIEGEFWLGLAGVASVAFGGLLFARPGAGALSVILIIGAYAIAFGIMLIALGLRVRRLATI